MKDEDKIHLYLGFILFGLSELMPFIKEIKSNGICDALWCAVCNSKCLDGVEIDEEDLEV
jgi:hypothetical protein